MSHDSPQHEGSLFHCVARRKTILQAVILIIAVGWTFSPTLLGDWQWDDRSYFTENPIMQDPAGLWKIWFQPGTFIEYYPISASVQWLQWQFFGKLTFGYHVTTIFLHLLSAFLLWRFFLKLGLRFAWLGALIFAIHPMTVESVAWISELKNTLSLPPFLLAMCAYLDYDDTKNSKDYFLALGLFLVAMLCKISMLTFPVLILVYVWCKRGRIQWVDIKASAPFFIISLTLGAMALWAGLRYEQVHGMENDPAMGIFSRLACAGLSLSFYIWKFFWPVELMPIYPQWKVDATSPTHFLPWLFLGGIFYGLLWIRPQNRRDILLAISFFVLILLPVLGFMSISYMRFTWVMDHFIYIPQIGLIGLLIGGLGCIQDWLRPAFRPCLIGVVLLVVGLMAVQSHNYAKHFLDEETLWAYELQHNPQAWPAYDNLGNALLRKGQVVKAEQLYRQALQIYPDSAITHNNLGVAQEQRGDIVAAISSYQEALKIAPGYLDAQHNLARLLAQEALPK